MGTTTVNRSETAAASRSGTGQTNPIPGSRSQSAVHNHKGTQHLAPALGWFSVGLGLSQILMPRRMAQLTGMRERPALMRMLGFRELTAGIGILGQRNPRRWLWGRVAGDGIDIALLLRAYNKRPGKRERLGSAIAAVAGVTALDLACATRMRGQQQVETGEAGDGAVRISKSIAVNRPVEDVYRFWRDLENLPRFMKHLKSVRVTGDGRSHWIAKAPAGASVEWDAELTDDAPNQVIAWKSLDGAGLQNRGSVRFEPLTDGNGSRVAVELEYVPPAGAVGALMAKLFGEEPEQQVREDLRRFKQVMETGETATTEGQSSGKRSTIAVLAKALNPADGKERS